MKGEKIKWAEVKKYCMYIMEPETGTIEDRAYETLKEFKDAYGKDTIKKRGFLPLYEDWLSGLALSKLAYYNYDILELAEKFGLPVKTPRQKEKTIEGWFRFIAFQHEKIYKQFGLMK